jgi:hypothetical protein
MICSLIGRVPDFVVFADRVRVPIAYSFVML